MQFNAGITIYSPNTRINFYADCLSLLQKASYFLLFVKCYYASNTASGNGGFFKICLCAVHASWCDAVLRVGRWPRESMSPLRATHVYTQAELHRVYFDPCLWSSCHRIQPQKIEKK